MKSSMIIINYDHENTITWALASVHLDNLLNSMFSSSSNSFNKFNSSYKVNNLRSVLFTYDDDDDDYYYNYYYYY